MQLRIDEDLKTKLEKYAEFLGTTGAYVVAEALRLVFNEDAVDEDLHDRQFEDCSQSDGEHTPVTKEKTKQPLAAAAVQPSTNGNRELFR